MDHMFSQLLASTNSQTPPGGWLQYCSCVSEPVVHLYVPVRLNPVDLKLFCVLHSSRGYMNCWGRVLVGGKPDPNVFASLPCVSLGSWTWWNFQMFPLMVSDQIWKGNSLFFFWLFILIATWSITSAEEGKSGTFGWRFSEDSDVSGCMKWYICEGDTKSNWARGFRRSVRNQTWTELKRTHFSLSPVGGNIASDGKHYIRRMSEDPPDFMDPRGHRLKTVLSTHFICLYHCLQKNNVKWKMVK